MAISYITLLSNPKLIPELFSDKRWQELHIDEKKEIIYSMFHIKNWKQLNPEYRIYILQEVENINASMQERVAYKIIEVENADLTGSINKGPDGSREIWINKKYLLNGIRYVLQLMPNGMKDMCEKQFDNANVELFCSICHEGEHAKQEEYCKSKVNTKEINECILNCLTNPDNEEENNIIHGSAGILYKFQPVEYYAFLNSENMTRRVFNILQAKFGIDEGYDKWNIRVTSDDFKALAKKWNADNNMKEETGAEYTVTGLRKQVINIMLDNVIKWYGIEDVFEACKVLNLDFKNYSPKICDDIVFDSNEK